jgi:hypothetical protein
MSVLTDRLDVRGHLTGLVAGEIELDAFVNWFSRSLWDIEQRADDDDYEMALTVENIIAEYTGGHITDEQLRAALRSLTEPDDSNNSRAG